MNQVFSPQSRGLTLHPSIRAAIFLVLFFRAAAAESPQAQPNANFVDLAQKAGLTMTTVFGGKDTKKYIIETTGTGVAIFDYDNDGWPDIFLVNGTTLEGFSSGTAPTNHLYRNNHDGTFSDVTVKAGLTVKIVLRAFDVIHSFYIPAFLLKIDVVPNHPNTYWFQSVQPGDYEIHCAEFCGLNHSTMAAILHVVK